MIKNNGCCDSGYARKLEELGVPQEDSLWYWVNSSYSSGFEGGETIWLCDGKWNLYHFKPDPESDETGIQTKKEGLIPDYFQRTYKALDECRAKMEAKIRNLLVYSAPTCAELGEKLPSAQCRKIFKQKYPTGETEYFFYINPDAEDELYIEADTEANARAKMLIWCIENKKMEVEDE